MNSSNLWLVLEATRGRALRGEGATRPSSCRKESDSKETTASKQSQLFFQDTLAQLLPTSRAMETGINNLTKEKENFLLAQVFAKQARVLEL